MTSSGCLQEVLKDFSTDTLTTNPLQPVVVLFPLFLGVLPTAKEEGGSAAV